MKKYMVIAAMATLVLTACGDKEETAGSSSVSSDVSSESSSSSKASTEASSEASSNTSSETSTDSSSDDSSSTSSDSSSAEDPVITGNPYFSQDYIYVPAEISYYDYVVTNEFNDKGWLTKSTGKADDYEYVTELNYDDKGSVVYVNYKRVETEQDTDPVTEEDKIVIFNEDGKTDDYEVNESHNLNVLERDSKGRATAILHVDDNSEMTDYSSFVISYSENMDKNMYMKLKDRDNNTISTTFFQNCHIPYYVVSRWVNIPTYFTPENVVIDDNGLAAEFKETGLKYSYDEKQRLVSVSEGEELLSTFTYDDEGRLITITNSDISSEYKTDDSGCDFKYDADGNISEICIYHQDGNPEIVKIKYEKVPLSLVGLSSYNIEEGSYVTELIDTDLFWNTPYFCLSYFMD